MTQAELQAQIDAMSAAGGGCVQVEAGTITLASRLVLQPGVWLRGRGPSTVLKAAAGYLEPFVVASGYTVLGQFVGLSDLCVDGNAAHADTGAGLGVMIQAAGPGSFVERCLVRNTMRAGIIVGSVHAVSIGVRVTGNTLVACGSPRSSMEICGLGAVNAIDLIIAGNIVQDSPTGVDLEIAPAPFAGQLVDILVAGNVIRTGVDMVRACWGISVEAQPERPAQNILISGNVLYGGNVGTAVPFLLEYPGNTQQVDNLVKSA